MYQNSIWQEYYAGTQQTFTPSLFAEEALREMEAGTSLLDLGCGNGRDSVFFCRNGIHVTAIDASKNAIAILEREEPRVRAVCEDVLTASVFRNDSYDSIYARFFFHTLTESEQAYLLKQCYLSLRSRGKLFIETRTSQDELCGTGERISAYEWLEDGHYRRFIEPDELRTQLQAAGFHILSFQSSRGFAPYEGQDPIILRVIAAKDPQEGS